ncbi:MAG: tetratricopeptide repeat protein [Phycisphaerales bacterium]|nr:tetratricopeptide repeat protein [Phycisphaerales bacterium]
MNARSVLIVIVIALAAGAGLWWFGGIGRPAPPPVLSSNLEQVDPMVRSAVEDTLTAIADDPRNAALRARLGMLYHANGLDEVAEPAYEQALAMKSDVPRWWHFLAMHRGEQGDLDGAREAEREAVRLDPNNGAAFRRLGQWSLESGDLDDALNYYNQAEIAQPTHPLNAFGAGRVLVELGRPDEAITRLTAALRAHPELKYGHVLLSRAYREAGRTAEAAQEAARGAGAAPVTDDPWMNELLAMRTGYSGTILEAGRLLAQGRADDAITTLNALRIAYPQDVTVLNHLANAYEATANYGKMRDVLEQALLFDESNFATHLNLSVTYERLRDYTAAMRHARRAIELNPTLGDAHRQYATLLARQESFDAAAEAFAQAIQNGRNDVETRLTHGMVLSRAGRWADAVTALEEFTRTTPDNAAGYIWLAQAYGRSGDVAKGRLALAQARALDPNNPNLKVVEEVLNGAQR